MVTFQNQSDLDRFTHDIDSQEIDVITESEAFTLFQDHGADDIDNFLCNTPGNLTLSVALDWLGY